MYRVRECTPHARRTACVLLLPCANERVRRGGRGGVSVTSQTQVGHGAIDTVLRVHMTQLVIFGGNKSPVFERPKGGAVGTGTD